jgi:hypothetical protein
MALSDYQIQIGDLVLGPGTDYIITIPPELGGPTMRTSDSEKPQEHGSYYGPDLFDARTFVIATTVRGDSAADTVQNVDALIAEWWVDSRVDTDVTKPLKVKFPGQEERILFGRPRRALMPTTRLVGNRSTGSLEYHAGDPAWYSEAEYSEELSLGTQAGGFGFPMTFPLQFGGTASGGSVMVTNAGSFQMKPTVRFTGPFNNPRIENVTTGKTLELDLIIASGDYVDVDFAAATVLLNGTASRYYTKSGVFWTLEPGDNEVRIGSTSYDAASAATIYWRDAWI